MFHHLVLNLILCGHIPEPYELWTWNLYYMEVLKYSDIYINNFVGHTDTTETTKNIVKVT